MTVIRFLLLCFSLSSATAFAGSIRPLQFDEIVDTAATAFHGRALTSRSERDPISNMIVTYTTFEVLDAYKGTMGSQVTIKQMGGKLEGTGEVFKVHGIPRYENGREYVLYLFGVSNWGFSSPVGLAQGSFSVVEENGRKWVSNGRDFRQMAPQIVEGQENEAGFVPYKPMPRAELSDLKRITQKHLDKSAASGVVK